MRIRVYLERVKLDAGGYVRKGQAVYHGAYFGTGAPLYHAQAEWTNPDGSRGTYQDEFRAVGRDHAKQTILTRYKICFPDGVRLVFAGKY